MSKKKVEDAPIIEIEAEEVKIDSIDENAKAPEKEEVPSKGFNPFKFWEYFKFFK